MRKIHVGNVEQEFRQTSSQLFQVSQRFADLKLLLLSHYMAEHHPDVQFQAKTVDDNLLSMDVVFPSLGRVASRELSNEINLYFQGLLDA